MGHKVNPISFRLGINKNWQSNWYADKKQYGKNLAEDLLIRKTILKKLGRAAGISNIKIKRSSDKIEIIINSGRPGVIIGRSGQGVEELKRILEKDLNGKKIAIEIVEIKRTEVSAALVAQQIAYQIEKRYPYKRAIRQAVEKVMTNSEVKGIKINISGRLGGAEIARVEKSSRGLIPLATLRSDIDYAFEEAYTSYGVIGIKTWIYKGEKHVNA